MKLYYDPVSTPSRPVMLLAAHFVPAYRNAELVAL
jgi:hypothetical protein